MACGARAGHQRPEQRRGEHEPDGDQRADGRALVVGELAEDAHRAEGGRGSEADEGAGGGHGTILPDRRIGNDPDL
jgi:hypothetical protein